MDETLPGLETFVAVAREGSFTAAARRLGLPGLTVSRRVARLEEVVGEALFERTTRHVSLTDAGRLLYERGARLVHAMRDLADEVAQVGGEPRGTLKVSTPTGFGRDYLVDFLVLLRARYPQVVVEVGVSSRPPHLIEGEYDLVVREGPPPEGPWIARDMGPADRLLVASPAYLARAGTPKSAADVVGHDCLALIEAGAVAEEWPLRGGGSFLVRPILKSNDLDLVREAALGGLGLALLSVPVVAKELVSGRLHVVLPTLVGREAKIYVLYPPARRDSPKLQAFFDIANEVAMRFGQLLVPSHLTAT